MAAPELPQPVSGLDIRALPLGPEDAYVLSRVDGRTSLEDIALSTGLTGERVVEVLAHLAELGAITVGPAAPPPAAEKNNYGAFGTSRGARPAVEVRDERPEDAAPSALYDPAELDEDVQIDLPVRRRILDVYYSLDRVNHYELLEVPAAADKRAIKTAYFRAVSAYHPDRHFGKRLGGFQQKLEAIFTRMTDAYDVLASEDRRREYEQYLGGRERVRALDSAAVDDARREIDRIRREIEDDARQAERTTRTPTPRSPSPVDPETRRRALARKLGKSSAPPARAAATSPPRDAAEDRKAVADGLRRLHDERLARAKAHQIAHYRKLATDAVAQGDTASAVGALKIALSLDPDADLQADLERTEAKLHTELAATYLASAQYEEQSRQYQQAAESYVRASRGEGRIRPKALERAAFCLLTAGGDLRRASELAKEAVSLAPEDAQARVTLARIYLGLELRKSALGEFERAAKLVPGDDTIKDWIKRMKKGEV